MGMGPRHRAYDCSLTRERPALRRWFAVWAGLLVMAFNVVAGDLLPLFPPSLSQGALGAVEDGRAFVVCTLHGLEVVRPQDSAPDGRSAAAKPQDDGVCLSCLPLLHGGVSAPTIVGMVRPEWVVLVALPIWTRAVLVPPAPIPRPVFPRAPPAV